MEASTLQAIYPASNHNSALSRNQSLKLKKKLSLNSGQQYQTTDHLKERSQMTDDSDPA